MRIRRSQTQLLARNPPVGRFSRQKSTYLAVGVATVAILALLASVGGTRAGWVASVPMGAGTLTSGELSLTVGNAGGQVADYTFAELAGSNLAPGGWSQAPLVLRNAGSVELGYRLLGTAATNPTGLPTVLDLDLKQVASSANCPTGVGAGTPTGVVIDLYQGPLLSATTTSDRTLGAGQTETLCFRVRIAPSASGSVQSGSTAITFSFAAVST